jgi:DNA-binding protein H-NS
MKQLAAIKQFRSLNVEDLLAIKSRLDAEIDARMGEERRRLTASLERFNLISDRQTSNRPGRYNRRKLAVKYRNPSNPNQTWAGRGLKPRWLVAELKGGKRKLADFEVKA